MSQNIVVVGAGVSGLTTALLLSKDKKVTVVAKHMPGDYDIEYTSPWAGANFLPMASKENQRWESRTWPELKRLAENVPEAGIHFQKARLFRRDKDMKGSLHPTDHLFDREPWCKSLFPDFRELPADEVPEGYQSGSEFTSVCINTATYLQWLLGQCLKNGVIVKRAVLSDINEAKKMSHTGSPATIVINATGLGSLKLGGVNDTTLTPARGQIVLVRNEGPIMLGVSGTDDGSTEDMYVMQRAGGGGTILGGTYDIGNWNANPDPNIALRIMKRVVNVFPSIADGKGIEGLDVIRHGVGLRPLRKDGVRIETDKMDEETWLVHNYGHAGWGYQASYGCAERVVELVEEIKQRNVRGSKL